MQAQWRTAQFPAPYRSTRHALMQANYVKNMAKTRKSDSFVSFLRRDNG
jgi:hypothetical protein